MHLPSTEIYSAEKFINIGRYSVCVCVFSVFIVDAVDRVFVVVVDTERMCTAFKILIDESNSISEWCIWFLYVAETVMMRSARIQSNRHDRQEYSSCCYCRNVLPELYGITSLS